MRPWLKWTLIGGAVLVSLAVLAVFATMAFVFSIGTRMVPVRVETTVRDARTGAPAAGCVIFAADTETAGQWHPAGRTSADGRVTHLSHHEEVGSMFWPFPREKKVWFRLFLGRPPRYATYDETEVWDVTLRFREPWSRGSTVQPEATVKRGLFHDEVIFPPPGRKWQDYGTKPLPDAPPNAFAAGALLVERAEDGRTGWRVPLTISLDEKQLAACRAPVAETAASPAAPPNPAAEYEERAIALFEKEKWKEALAMYREAAERFPDRAWAPLGAGDCIHNMGRDREAMPWYRRALSLAPQDLEVRYALANALLTQDAAAAERDFRRLVAEQPGEARNWIGFGNALYQRDRYRESVKAYAKAEALCAKCLTAYDREVADDARKRAR